MNKQTEIDPKQKEELVIIALEEVLSDIQRAEQLQLNRNDSLFYVAKNIRSKIKKLKKTLKSKK